MMPLGQGYNQPLSTKKAVREQKWEGWREMSSALGQASALLPYLQSLQPQCHTCLDSKAMEINTWWHEHQNACPYFPVTDSQGICSSVTNRAMSRWWRWSFTASSAPPLTLFVFWSPPWWSQDRGCHCQSSKDRAEVWLSREMRCVTHLGVSQSARWLFRRKTKQQDEREAPWMAACEWWGSGAGGRRCATWSRFARHRKLCSHCDVQPHSKCILIIQ